MYLRVTTIKRKHKTYRYAQIVESYRREDGTPTNRIIASLGSRSKQEIAALRQALAVARDGAAAVLPAQALPRVQVLHSLRYLDVALLLQTWRDSGLRELLTEALGQDQSSVPSADIIVSLILQRCLAPASKLAASRWFPTTALPELLGVAPELFNNSRVHRALTRLEAAEARLKEQLPSAVSAAHGAAAVLFLDATDTWFVGHGPPMAAKGRDKQGQYRRRVGIVMLCDGHGLPLRWHTLDGRYHDPTALGDMAEQVARLDWAASVPIVADRALGNAHWVDKLDALGLRYITCVPAPELESCGAPIPWESVTALQGCGDDLAAIEAAATRAGFVRDERGYYALELGLFTKRRPPRALRSSQARLALDIVEALEAPDASDAAVAQRFGLSRRSVQSYKHLTALDARVRQAIGRGDADGLSTKQLRQLARVPAERQVAQLEAMVATTTTAYRRAHRRHVEDPSPMQARGALWLNPQRLVDDRAVDEAGLARVTQLVDDINRRLASPRSQRTDRAALNEAERLIHRRKLGNVCSVSMSTHDGSRRVVLAIDQRAWQRRRHSDGITLVITHPDVSGTATERVRRYFDKDAIEKDFQSIKSVLGLRPVRHRTDHKLRAHVTICVLALLLARMLELRCAARGHPHTMAAIAERLEPVRLNIIDDGTARYYAATQPSDDVASLLEGLGVTSLADNATIAQQVTPR